MKESYKVLFSISILIMAAISAATQVPVKLFDIRNGNGLVDNGTANPQATYIVYKGAQSKQQVIDSFAYIYGYVENVPNPAFDPKKAIDSVTNPQLIPNPQSKQSFYHQQLSRIIKSTVRSKELELAIKATSDATSAAVDATLPPF